MDDNRVYIMDVFNRGIYPHDGFAKSKNFSNSANFVCKFYSCDDD